MPDPCFPEDTYDARSGFFALVAEEEPPCTIPGSATSNFFSTVQLRVFTQASSHRCHEGFSSHALHSEQGMLERITCVDMSREDSRVVMFERQDQARMIVYHIMKHM